MNNLQQPTSDFKSVGRLRILWLLLVASLMRLAGVPYRLKEIAARQCGPEDEPTFWEILNEFFNAFGSGKVAQLPEFKPTQINATREDALKTIADLGKEKAKDGSDRLDTIEKKAGVLFTAVGLLISLCAFLIDKDGGRWLAVPLLICLLFPLTL